MTPGFIRARPPRGDAVLPRIVDDPDVLSSYLEDAAHFPGGHAEAIAKLEQMRQTVDEKLQATLETRLGESFRLVSPGCRRG